MVKNPPSNAGDSGSIPSWGTKILHALWHGKKRMLPSGAVVKNLPANAGDTGDSGLIPGSGRSPGEGNGNPLQHSYLGNPTERGAWWATVRGVAKSWTRLSG